jgi:hypothetical protein
MDLNAIVNQFLSDAESRFGPKCNEWKFYGVEINDYTPHLRYYPDTGNVTISLSKKVLLDKYQLYFQLAHEICHLLYPQKNIITLDDEIMLNLNEGISTYFSFEVIKDNPDFEIILEEFENRENKYFSAFRKVEELLDLDKNIIKKARIFEPKVNKLTSNIFKSVNDKIPDNLLFFLLQPF